MPLLRHTPSSFRLVPLARSGNITPTQPMQHGTCLVAKKKLRPQREGHHSMSSELGNTIHSQGLQQGRKSRPPHGLGSQSALCNLRGQQHLDEFSFLTLCKEEQQDARRGNKDASFGSASIGDDEVARDNGLPLQGRSHGAISSGLGSLCGNRGWSMESPWPQHGAPWAGYSLFKAEKPSHVDKVSCCITGVAAQGNPIAAPDFGDSMNTFCVDADPLQSVVQSADLGRAMCHGRGTNKSAVAGVVEVSDSENSLSGEFPDLVDDRACSRDEQQHGEEEENSSVTAEVIAAESLLALDVLADAAFQAGIQDSAAAAATSTSKAVFVHGGFRFVQKKRAKSILQQQELLGEAGKLRRSRRRIIPGSQLGLGGSKAKIEECSPIARSKRGRARLLPSKFQDSVLGHWKKKKRRANA